MRRGLRITLVLLATCAVALVVEPAGKADGPKRVAHCLEERFADSTGPYSSVVFPPSKPLTLIPADADCLDSDPSACTGRVPIDTKKHWSAGARVGEWVCITDGVLFGWTAAAPLSFGPSPVTKKKDWLGRWSRQYGGARFRVDFAPHSKTLHVIGTAEWLAGPDATPHLGDLDADGVLVENELRLGDPRCLDGDFNEEHDACYDCVARLMMINGRIFVIDNHRCGGMNVNFDGIYDSVQTRPHN